MTSDNRKLHLCCCAEVVDHDYDAPFVIKLSVLHNLSQKHLTQLVRRQHVSSLYTWLPMDTEAKLHFVVAELEAWFANRR